MRELTLRPAKSSMVMLVFLTALPAAAHAAQWSASPGNSNFNSGSNWTGGVVPNTSGGLTAEFGASSITNLNVTDNANVPRFEFLSGAPAYTFNIASGKFLNLNRTATGDFFRGAANTVNIAGPGTLQFISSATSGNMSLQGNGGPVAVNINAPVTGSGNGNNMLFPSGGTFAFNGPTSLSGWSQLNINSNAAVAFNNDLTSNNQIRLTGNGAALRIGKTMTNAYVTDVGANATASISLTGNGVEFNRFVGWASSPSSDSRTVTLSSSNTAATSVSPASNTISSALTVFAPTGTGSATVNLDASAFNTLNVTGVISGGNGAVVLAKTGVGTVILSGAAGNTFSGSAQVNSGTLVLAKSSGNAIAGSLVVGDGSGSDVLRLDGANQIGDLATVGLNGGMLNLNGFSESLATLSILNTSTVDFGTGATTLALSNLARTAGGLTVLNWTEGSDALRVTTLPAESTLANITFAGHDAGAKAVLKSGAYELTPVPEPAAIGAVTLAAAAGLGRRRRRVAAV